MQFYHVYWTGTVPTSNINLEKASSVQPESSSVRLIRKHLLELVLHLSKHPVLQDIDQLVNLLDADMPYSASLIGLPGLLLMFKYERSKPSRAMQLLQPDSLTEFKKGIARTARYLLETSL